MYLSRNLSAQASPDLETIRDAVGRPWNSDQYLIPVPPLVIATIEGLDTTELLDVLDMAIKVPESKISLPKSVQSLTEFVLFCNGVHEDLVGDSAGYYAYLTINQGTVIAGNSQRNAGIHFDGMQGSRYPKKLLPCHQFLASTALPTRWHIQPFSTVGLDDDKDNWFKAFDDQALRTSENMWEPEPGEIVLSTAYAAHEAVRADEDTGRTFVRLEFTQKIFDRKGNTVTPLSADWDWQPRMIPKHLV